MYPRILAQPLKSVDVSMDLKVNGLIVIYSHLQGGSLLKQNCGRSVDTETEATSDLDSGVKLHNIPGNMLEFVTHCLIKKYLKHLWILHSHSILWMSPWILAQPLNSMDVSMDCPQILNLGESMATCEREKMWRV